MGKVAMSMTTRLEDPEKVTRSSDHRTGEGEHALTTKKNPLPWTANRVSGPPSRLVNAYPLSARLDGKLSTFC
jgi:hypothetical protein